MVICLRHLHGFLRKQTRSRASGIVSLLHNMPYTMERVPGALMFAQHRSNRAVSIPVCASDDASNEA